MSKELTDKEFIDAIEARFASHGWQKGRIGTFNSCNCLLGAAAFAVHGEGLETDEYNPVSLDGVPIGADYLNVPAMVRLAAMIYPEDPNPNRVFGPFSDEFSCAEEVMDNLRKHLGLDTPE